MAAVIEQWTSFNESTLYQIIIRMNIEDEYNQILDRYRHYHSPLRE